MKLNRVRDNARKLLSHTLGSVVAGLVVGCSVFGAIAYDDIAKGYDTYEGQRSDFYAWVLQFPVLAGALSGASVYFFLPEIFRFLGREASLADRLDAYAEQLAQSEADPEDIALVINLAEQAKRRNA